jgi:thiamine pyrophosphate-dependent acetolactate synthase large subunit-like protein
MDIARTILKHSDPRLKLDSATFGTMGIGLPFTIAAKL